MEEIKEEENVESGLSESDGQKNFFCRLDTKNRIIVGFFLIALILAGGIFFLYKEKQKKYITLEEARAKIEGLADGQDVKLEIVEVVKEGDLYKVSAKVNGAIQNLYVTRDGKNLVQGLMSFEEIEKQKELAKKQKPEPKEVPKSDKPKVELFVMSYCPYGTQMEKGILSVVNVLGGKIDYSLRFVDYVMHGDKEIAENLRQYCIQKNQPSKLGAYLKCFLKKGEGTADTCLAENGINSANIKACVAQTDAKFSVTKNAQDKSTWNNGQFPSFDVNKEENEQYQIQGSPTLVVNGVVIDSARDSAGILKNVCNAFNIPPKECEAKLESAVPNPGFGEGATAGSGANASCGN